MNSSTIKFADMKAPNTLYDKIKSIEYLMEDYIHDLVWQYGKQVGEDYEISLYDKHTKRYCIIENADGSKTYVKKLIILSPDKCQVRGHLMLELASGEKVGFCQLNHQEFNVFSPLYRKIEEKIEKES